MSTLERVAHLPTWLLSQANNRAHVLLSAAFAAEGVRGYHFRVLAALDQHGEMSQAELGRRTGLDRSDVATTVDELVTKKLVRRSPDAADRRRKIVALTSRGRTRLAQLDVVVESVQQEVLAPLTASERRELLRLLAKLRS